jgi:hypothetical protein
LAGGVKVRGRVTSDGSNALPDTPVSITNTGTLLEIANVMSGSDGYFQANVPTGTYCASPLGEFGESVTPTGTTVTATTSGATVYTSTFTLGPAFGTIKGALRDSTGESITTGVLLLASTGTISNPPPDITSSLRSGSQVYYMISSRGDGTYSLDVRAGTYNLYGWYSTFSGEVSSTTVKSLTNIQVTPGATVTGKDLQW